MTSTDPQPPWFSGFCLQGELAGQYELEEEETPQLLELEGLGPITIFVGANNSGKSRLLRQLFGNPEATQLLRIGYESNEYKSDQQEFCKSIDWAVKFKPEDRRGLEEVMAAVEAFQAYHQDLHDMPISDWAGVNAVALLDKIYARIESHVQARGYSVSYKVSRNPQEDEIKRRAAQASSVVIRSLREWADLYKSIGQSQLRRRMHDYLSLRRCYVPMLRGMRPPLALGISDRHGVDGSDCYEERSIRDYFGVFPGWRPLNDGQEDEMGRTDQRQAPVFSEKPRIFTGLSLYHDIQKRLLAPSQEERQSIREYEKFLSVTFFQGREVTLTPALHNKGDKGNDVVYIKIGESEDRPIYDLGDGMQSLIICTYPIITELQQGSLFFLEEPDLCMHPSLQRAFLNVLKDSYRKKGHQFFLTTHSNHLLDLLVDDDLVSIFSFSENETRPETAGTAPSQSVNSPNEGQSIPYPRFRIRPTPPRDRRALVELGVRPSSTYLANATIWVEGVSDHAYLRAYMEAFLCYLESRGGKWGQQLAGRLGQYREDRHYAFVEYNGSNLPHFSFVEEFSCVSDRHNDPNSVATIRAPSLCAQAIVLADGDIETKGGGVREQSFVAQLGERFVKLPGKEIENLIPPELLKQQIEFDLGENLLPANLEAIDYVNYARSGQGMGGYLDGIGIGKYAPSGSGNEASKHKSGTLPYYYKDRWRSDSKGIPHRVRKSIEAARVDAAQAVERKGQPFPLPEYITQDLVWLCVVVFVHVAEANHDRDAVTKLREFKDWIVSSFANLEHPQADSAHSAALAPDDLPGSEHSYPPEWPLGPPVKPQLNDGDSPSSIPSYRVCLLTQFLQAPQLS